VRDGERSRSLPWLALVVLALGVPAAGCGASGGMAQAEHALTSDGAWKSAASVTATERTGGLTVALTATLTPAKIGSMVQFGVTASDRHALGALGYQLRYGDGTSAENLVPQFCVAGKDTPTRQAWRLSHAYKAAGRYRVSVTVYVNCTSDHATTAVSLIVT
jgi:hypothetical protein